MSWFYEALMRAEGKPAGPDMAAVGTIDKDGDSFLGEIEALSAAAVGNGQVRAERYAKPTALEEIIPLPPRPGVNSAGFRLLTVAFREESRLVFHTDPLGIAAEQFRLLRRSLVQTFPRGATLMITSPGAGDGKTLTALNLCACLTDGGDSTLLVEVDLRRPSVHRALGCTVEPPGVEDALRGKETPEKTIHFIGDLGFHAAMVARIPKDPSHLLSGRGTKDLLAWARPRFRWIVFDTAPVMPNADVAELLPAVDAALLVIRVQATPKELARRAFDVLGKRLHGVVLNEANVSSTPYYRYLSDYYQPAANKGR